MHYGKCTAFRVSFAALDHKKVFKIVPQTVADDLRQGSDIEGECNSYLGENKNNNL